MTREKSTLQPSEVRWQKHLPNWNGVRASGTLLFVRQSGLSFSLPGLACQSTYVFYVRLPYVCLSVIVCKVSRRTVFDHWPLQPACFLACLTTFLSGLPDRLPVLPAWPVTTFLSCLPDRLPVYLLCLLAWTACLSMYCTCLLLACLIVSLLYLLAWPSVCQLFVAVCLPLRKPTESVF